MKVLGYSLLLLGLSACGSSSSECDGTDASCTATNQYSSMALGDSCKGYGEDKWAIVSYKGEQVAGRCADGLLGETRKDRLRCLRKGYEVKLSKDRVYAFCQDSSSRYSLLYDTDFGAHKPWRCDTTKTLDYVGFNSSNKEVELLCADGFLTLATGMSTGTQESFDPDTGAIASCQANLSETFPAMKLEDFDPKVEKTETFKPEDICQTPVEPSTTKPDNISGSYIR